MGTIGVGEQLRAGEIEHGCDPGQLERSRGRGVDPEQHGRRGAQGFECVELCGIGLEPGVHRASASRDRSLILGWRRHAPVALSQS